MDKNLTLREHRSGDEIFQHTEGVWNISAIREGIATEPETFTIIDMPLSQEFIRHIRTNLGINIKRARALTLEQRDEPGLVIVREREHGIIVFMIDGHHRAIRRWRDGFKTMQVHVIAEEVGEMWRIKDDTLILSLEETSIGKTTQ